jgi:hypothetical protein
MFDEQIPAHFIQYAADILDDRSGGLSGAKFGPKNGPSHAA